jgi:hypothetical protein
MKKVVTLAVLVFIILLSYVFYLRINTKISTPLTADDYEPDTYTVIDESEDSLVEEFPELPEYPDAELVNSRQYTEEGGEGFSSEYRTNDSVSDVVDWYKEEISDKWILIYESEEVPDPDFYLIEYKKPDIQLDVHVVELEDGEVKITVTHHEGMGEYGPKVKYE